jgi:metallo-beta-lactamase family protein
MKVKFCGATTGVTGSCHMIYTDNHRILLDCGQFQGGKAQDRLNYEEFPFDPKEIEAVVLSHAHIDHCGRLPLLVNRGFTGKIYCTKPTADLLPIMLRDSGYIHEKEAEWQNKKGARKGRPPVEPLYTVEDAERSLSLITPVLYDQIIEINDEMTICFNDAGHILGSAITELWVKEDEKSTKIVFSGDLGMRDRPILRDPVYIKKADYVIMESTYGNRLHPDNVMDIQRLLNVIMRTVKRGGTVVIPSFAVGRTQEMIYELNKFYDNNPDIYKELRDIKVYIDSPMATSATQVFSENAAVFDEEARNYIMNGDDPLKFANLVFTKSTEESQALNNNSDPKIVISASGMCEAGRIRHHLKHNLWDPKSSIVFVGYQAEGTLGRKIIEGAKSVNIFGEEVQVNAEIVNLEGFSGHADRDGLTDWMNHFTTSPKVFLVHGEKEAKHDLALHLGETIDVHPIVIDSNSEFDLKPGESSASMLSEEEESPDERLDEESLMTLRDSISEINASIGDTLMSAALITGENVSPEQLIKINNIVQELRNDAISLRQAVLDEKNTAAPE